MIIRYTRKHVVQQTIICLTAIWLATLPYIPQAQAEEGVCAEVKLEIPQELTLERQAFEPHMRIRNGIAHLTLEDLHITLHVTDEAGYQMAVTSNPNDLNAAFFLRRDDVSGVANVNPGSDAVITGAVDPSSTADIYWLS